MPPAGPIYASTLHRRDRSWGPRRRAAARLRAMVWASTAAVAAAALITHFG